MKKDRLLEIIREEISEALNVLVTNKKGETTTMPFNTPDEKKSVTNLKADSNITNIETTAGQNIKEGEKRKKIAEKYQIDEETINEMASIKQLKSELERQGKTSELKAVADAERAALDALKADPTITSDGRLKGYVPTLKKELLNTHNIKLQDLLSTVAGKAEDDGVKFSSDIATNTIEKDAANQITGKEAGQRGRKATEKPAKAEKAPKAKPAATPKAEPMDDEEAAAAKAAGSDETAKELGNIASRKDKVVKAYKQFEPELKDKIAQAKAGDKDAVAWLKQRTPIIQAYKKAQQVNV